MDERIANENNATFVKQCRDANGACFGACVKHHVDALHYVCRLAGGTCDEAFAVTMGQHKRCEHVTVARSEAVHIVAVKPLALETLVEEGLVFGQVGRIGGVDDSELANSIGHAFGSELGFYIILAAYDEGTAHARALILDGGAQHRRTAAERAEAMAAATRAVQATCHTLQTAGFPVPLVTGAGTGTFSLEASSGVWGELQAGSYLFMDADYASNEATPLAPVFEHALFVKSQVMSLNAAHAVCDAGHKSHAIDSGMPSVWFPPGLNYSSGGDEHGVLRAEGSAPLPALGEVVWLVPGHCDPTVNLHDFMVGVRGGLAAGQVERIVRVDARGCLG